MSGLKLKCKEFLCKYYQILTDHQIQKNESIKLS